MTKTAEHALETALALAWPVESWRDLHVVLAVSGGPDSVALLHAILAWKHRQRGQGQVFVAHFNHRLRGDSGDEDQAWLEALCRDLDVPLVVGRADVDAVPAGGDGWEAAARDARYDFLRQTAERGGARFVVVAHNADDQAETVLHHILRGTGIAGLAGMPWVRRLSPTVSLVRPLLDVTRRDIRKYLQAIGQEFRTDATNADSRWTRNRLRNELLPTIRARFNADVDAALLRLAQQAGEAQEFLAEAAAELASRCVAADCSSQPTTVRIDCRQLAGQPQLLVREVCKAAWNRAGWPLQAMGFDQWLQLSELAGGLPNGSILNLPGNVRAWREGEALVLAGDHLKRKEKESQGC